MSEDLDIVLDGFAQLDPDEALKVSRQNLFAAIDAATAAIPAPEPNAQDVQQAQAQLSVKQLWNAVRSARVAFDADPTKLPELSSCPRTPRERNSEKHCHE
jgi:hypothetical protein